MDLFRAAERLMAMDDRAWARHASDASVYTRIASSVPWFLALWSVHWIGGWAVVPLGLMAAWTVANPRLFAAPARADGWAQRGVLGERAFLNRAIVPIPVAFVRAGWITTAVAIVLLAVTIWGLVIGDIALAATGWAGALVAKLWFVDRMAWLWGEMKDRHPVYAAWARADWRARLEV
ncbi:MAG: DUF6653 family protein [Pseudomonadota bacterium]